MVRFGLYGLRVDVIMVLLFNKRNVNFGVVKVLVVRFRYRFSIFLGIFSKVMDFV